VHDNDNEPLDDLDRLAVEGGKQSPVLHSEPVSRQEYGKCEDGGSAPNLAVHDSTGSSGVVQKSTKELAKIKKREDKGMGMCRVLHCYLCEQFYV